MCFPRFIFCAACTTNCNISKDAVPASLKTGDGCPGVGYFLKQNSTDTTFLQKNMSGCRLQTLSSFTENQGVVYGLCGGSTVFCALHVEVRQGMYVRAHVKRSAFWCGVTERNKWRIDMKLEKQVFIREQLKCDYSVVQDLFFQSAANSMWIVIVNKPAATINLHAIEYNNLFLQNMTQYSGYINIPRVHSMISFSTELTLPSEHIVMVSVLQSNQLYPCHDHSPLRLTYKKQNTSQDRSTTVCTERSIPAALFIVSYIRIYFVLNVYKLWFVKMAFSAFCVSAHPHKLRSGLINCSVISYFKFHHFLQCNMKTECEDGRDETEHCPFSGPRCQGMVASTNKCFKLVMLQTVTLGTIHLSNECKKYGQQLASLKTIKELEDSLPIFKHYYEFEVIFGYTSGWHLMTFIYSMCRKWSDNTIIFNENHFIHGLLFRYTISRKKVELIWGSSGLMGQSNHYTALCEFKLDPQGVFPRKIAPAKSESTQPTFTHTRQALRPCSHSHVIHSFMYCNLDSYCRNTYNSEDSAFLKLNTDQEHLLSAKRNTTCAHAMFSCINNVKSIHYTLVCDFIQDCPDNTDESFCEHPLCQGFTCSNAQCALHSQHCNEHSDCVDDSDEVSCQQQDVASCAHCMQFRDVKMPHQFYINLDGTGYFTQQTIKPGKPCPSTHYLCTSEWLYCLPVYTRCNGFFDCVNGEDEQDCNTIRCSGLFQCRTYTICLHEDHLCDGWGQCPQRDDELMCDMTCPEGCVCQGHSFLCRNTFPVDRFSQLRYVDATGSGMSLYDFKTNTYSIRLILASCYISNVSGIQLPNLQYIDIASNLLNYLDISSFLELQNLNILHLARNPIKSNTIAVSQKGIHYSLMVIDVSQTHLDALNSEQSIFVPLVKHLNVSSSAIRIIGSSGFKNAPRLLEVDMRFIPLTDFPLDLLSASDHLQNIFASNYRFCCENFLPKRSAKIKCSAPYTVLPSCTKLIPTQLYRVFFWVVCVCSTAGNLVCLISLFKIKGFENSSLTIGNLLFTEWCMGYHVSIVTTANEILNDRYIHSEKIWINSLSCKVAEFLFYLSSEVSVLIIGFITIVHISIICFGKDTYMLKESAFIVPWCAGTLMSLVPFLPGLSHRGLQGQSGLCRIALLDQLESNTKLQWSDVILTINCIICLQIMVGQVVINKRTPKFRTMLNSAAKSVYFEVHLVRKVATTNSISWIILGFIMVMAIRGSPDLNNIHDTVIVFGLPLSSALSPFLYLWTVVTQSQQKALEEKVLTMLKSQLVASGKQAFKPSKLI